MDLNDAKQKLSLKESAKVICVTLIGLGLPLYAVGFVANKLFSLHWIWGISIGVGLIIAIIFMFGLYKPVYENENTGEDDEEDDD